MRSILVALLTLASGTQATANPPQSIPPSAAFVYACYGATKETSACNKAALADINSARAQEGLGVIHLPSGFYTLGRRSQLIAVTNAERTSRGLPLLPARWAYNQMAQNGAAAQTDPIGPANHAWGSIWAGVADPLAADYLWMYDDGPNGINADCTQPGAPGCWGHRDNILGGAWTAMGAGASGASVAELFVQ
jgi:uncharacterized protein YkwD